MSTRATVHFQYKGKSEAIIYRHSDGYPDGLGKDLERFLSDVGRLADNRYGDASYLASKFIVWQTLEYDSDGTDPLAVIGIGVVKRDPGDIEYRYLLECSGGKPSIKIEEVH